MWEEGDVSLWIQIVRVSLIVWGRKGDRVSCLKLAWAVITKHQAVC